MAFIAYTLPIVPGREAEAGSFGADSESWRERYEELNQLGGVKRHMEWVQEFPTGSQLIVVFETDTPEALGRDFTDDAYDRWWTGRVERLHGFDPRTVHPSLPELVFEWTTEDGA